MSDMERHIHATELEEVRHGAAQEEEMALHINLTDTPEQTAAHVEQLNAQIALAQTRARTSAFVAVAVAGMIVLAALFALVLVLRDRSEQSQINGGKIDNLTIQLKDAQKLLVETQNRNAEKTACTLALDTATRLEARKTIIAIGELTVIIATIPPGDDRTEAIGTKVADLQASSTSYRSAAAMQEAWLDAGFPMPCPI